MSSQQLLGGNADQEEKVGGHSHLVALTGSKAESNCKKGIMLDKARHVKIPPLDEYTNLFLYV